MRTHHTHVLTCELLCLVPVNNNKQSQAASLQAQFCLELPGAPNSCPSEMLYVLIAGGQRSHFSVAGETMQFSSVYMISHIRKYEACIQFATQKTLWHPLEANIWFRDSQQKHNHEIKEHIRLRI